MGPYVLSRPIGSGGMAEVHLGHRQGLDGFERAVAIKTINGHGVDRDAVRLFLDEARAASNLEHSGIVRTIDLGFDDDTLYIVMEYVAGPPLSRILRALKERGRALRPPLVAHLGAQVAMALDYAHHRAQADDGRRLRLVHRDVSPHNVLITRQGGVKLTDFGIARSAIQHHVTRTGMVRGKAAYMAPEQVMAKPLDGRADLFSLGLVLYEALTLRRPFERKDEVSSMRAVVKDVVPPVESVVPGIQPELARWIGACLEKSPAQRPERAELLARGLERTLVGHSTAALEAGWGQLVEALFGAGNGESTHEEWHPTLRAGPSLRAQPATPSSPSSPSALAEILVELSPAPPREAPDLLTPYEVPLAPVEPTPGLREAPSRTLTQRVVGHWPWLALMLLVVLAGVLGGLIYGGQEAPMQSPPPAQSSPAPSPQPPEVMAAAPTVAPKGDPATPLDEAQVVRVAPSPTAKRPTPKPTSSPAPPTPAEVRPRLLVQLERQLVSCESEDASAHSIIALGEALAKAAAQLPDADRGARIARNARASANLGEVAGLRRAYRDLVAAWPGAQP